MYCSKCGKQINENSQYCKYCGHSVASNNVTNNSNQENTSKTNSSIDNKKNTAIGVIAMIIIGVIIGIFIFQKNMPDQISTYYSTSNRGNSITISNFNDSRYKRTIDSYTKTDGIVFSNKVVAVGVQNSLSYYIVIGWKNNYYYVSKMYPTSIGLSQIKYTENSYPKTMTIEEVIEKVTGFLGAYEYCIFTVSNI